MRRTLLLTAIADLVSRLMLACVFVTLGIASLALMTVWPFSGVGLVLAGGGLRLISPCSQRRT